MFAYRYFYEKVLDTKYGNKKVSELSRYRYVACYCSSLYPIFIYNSVARLKRDALGVIRHRVFIHWVFVWKYSCWLGIFKNYRYSARYRLLKVSICTLVSNGLVMKFEYRFRVPILFWYRSIDTKVSINGLFRVFRTKVVQKQDFSGNKTRNKNLWGNSLVSEIFWNNFQKKPFDYH